MEHPGGREQNVGGVGQCLPSFSVRALAHRRSHTHTHGYQRLPRREARGDAGRYSGPNSAWHRNDEKEYGEANTCEARVIATTERPTKKLRVEDIVIPPTPRCMRDHRMRLSAESEQAYPGHARLATEHGTSSRVATHSKKSGGGGIEIETQNNPLSSHAARNERARGRWCDESCSRTSTTLEGSGHEGGWGRGRGAPWGRWEFERATNTPRTCRLRAMIGRQQQVLDWTSKKLRLTVGRQ